jgi:hypothetical protein
MQAAMSAERVVTVDFHGTPVPWPEGVAMAFREIVDRPGMHTVEPASLSAARQPRLRNAAGRSRHGGGHPRRADRAAVAPAKPRGETAESRFMPFTDATTVDEAARLI